MLLLSLGASCATTSGAVLQLHDPSGTSWIEFEQSASATLKGDANGINAGVPSWGLGHMVLLAREVVPRIKPDILVVQYSEWLVDRALSFYMPTFWAKLPGQIQTPRAGIRAHLPFNIRELTFWHIPALPYPRPWGQDILAPRARIWIPWRPVTCPPRPPGEHLAGPPSFARSRHIARNQNRGGMAPIQTRIE